MKSQYEYYIQYEQVQEQSESTFKNYEDGHRYAMFVQGNKYNIGGRTYIFKDEHGEYVSSFVSQYSKIIDKNLEPLVKQAVLALHKKGYLTFTSCQGHQRGDNRYVGIVFNTKKQKEKFINEVNNLKCDIHWYDNVINTVERPCQKVPLWATVITLHIVFDDFTFANSSIVDRRERPYTDNQLTKFWNIQMCRNYDHYECIIMCFGYPMLEKNIFHKIKKLLFFDYKKVSNSYISFLNRVENLTEYEG
jgi:hypothetical protein